MRVVVAVLGLALLTAGFGIDRDELACERAVARLAECCPGFNADGWQCSHATGCGSGYGPDIGIEAGECIAQASCDDLVRSGACGAPAQVTCR